MDVDYLIREARLLKYPVKSHVIGAQHGLMATCIDPRAVSTNCLASFTSSPLHDSQSLCFTSKECFNGRAVSSASDYQNINLSVISQSISDEELIKFLTSICNKTFRIGNKVLMGSSSQPSGYMANFALALSSSFVLLIFYNTS